MLGQPGSAQSIIWLKWSHKCVDVVALLVLEVELSTNLREVSQCPEKAPTRAFSLLKASICAFTVKNLLRHYKLNVNIIYSGHFPTKIVNKGNLKDL